MGKTKCESAFSCLAWDTFDEDNQYPYGVIVGGLHDGSLTIWDPNDIIAYCKKNNFSNSIETNIGCICYEQGLFSSPVQSIEFNPFKSNLIAAGGGSEVLIMNIERNISSPEIFSPGTPNLHQGSIISSVSWNKKVQHILASASLNGLTVVWDLKTNKPIFNFQDSSITYNRNIALSWNPEIPTQIAVSYDDEKNCELQIWDLRNPQGPVMLFGQGHTKGINCVNWCTNDPSLILTGGRDDKIVCWNYKNGERISEMKTDENVKNVKWSPKLQSIFSVTHESGNITINTLSSEDITNYAPKWYKTPVFGRFGRNNKLSVFMEEKPTSILEFQIQKPDDKIAQELKNFESVYAETEKNNDFSKFCDLRISSTELTDQSKMHWSFIKSLINNDKSTYSNSVIEVLGLSKNDIIKLAEDYTGKTHRKQDEGSPKQSTSSSKLTKNNNFDFTLMSNKDAEGFFDQLSQVSTQKPDQKPKQLISEVRKDSSLDQEIMALDTISKNVNWDAGIEKIIKQNILIGNYEGAVDCALKCGRNGEALLLAYSHSSDLFEATANAFLVASKDTFIKNFFKNIIERQNKEIAKGHNIEAWREVAALSISSKKPEEFQEIMNILGQRLIDEINNPEEALLCFLLSRNVEKLIEIFNNKINALPLNSIQRKLSVINYSQKLIVLLHILGVGIKKNNDFDKILEEFSLICLDYGLNILAYKVLLFGNEKTLRLQVLKDLIYHSNEEVENIFKTPVFPFKFENVMIKIQSKIDQKKKPAEQKQIFSHQTPIQENINKNRPTTSGMPDVFVPSKNQPTKGEAGPPKSNTPFNSQPFPPSNPIKNQIIPPIQSSNVDRSQNHNFAPIKPPPPGNKAFKPKQEELHPPNVTPQINRVQPLNENRPANLSNFPLEPPKKPIEKEKQPEYINQNPIPPSFDHPISKPQPPQTSIQKTFQMKNPPPRPGQFNLPNKSNIVADQSLREEQKPMEAMKYLEDNKQIKEEELSLKKIDYNNISSGSQTMINTVNKAKNLLGVFEPNMRRKMELEKTLDLLKELIAGENLKPETYSNVFSLLQCWENGNSAEALTLHTKIAASDWDQNKDWLKTMKRVLLRK